MGGQISIAVFDKTASNPVAHIHDAIALFSSLAPEVSLHLHVAPINVIERGVIDGQFQVGVIPGHRSSQTMAYEVLFDETMLLYCGADHALFNTNPAGMGWDDLHSHHFAGLGYHSPNMEISQQMGLPRMATGYDQESIATLILSGKYLGFLPNHYAQGFARSGQMRAVKPDLFRYECSFFSIVRRSPELSRVTSAFHDCLLRAHRSNAF
jgi:DNA-binding transcriptional LysR family regulator